MLRVKGGRRHRKSREEPRLPRASEIAGSRPTVRAPHPCASGAFQRYHEPVPHRKILAPESFSPMPTTIQRPLPGEYGHAHEAYIEAVPEGNILDRLVEQAHATQALLRGLDQDAQTRPYAPGKWNIKEVLCHLTDAERIFCVRALCFARGETAELPGFDHDSYVATSCAARRSLSNLLEEYASVRGATLRLFESFSEEDLTRSGTASGQRVSVRALAWIIAGHERHHQRLLRERYLSGTEALHPED